MSGYKPSNGDVVVIEASESGQQWFAKVERVSPKFGPVVWWHRRDNSGGNRGTNTKPRTLARGKETLVRKAAPFEAAAFERGEL
mgnify:CR=1 FL=1